MSETYILHEGVLSLFWLSPNKSLHLVWSKWEGGVTSNVVLQGARFRARTSACLLFTLISPLPRTVIFPFQRCNHPRPQSLIFYLPAAPISIKSGGNLEGKARVNEPPCENPSLSTNLDAKHFSRRARQASHHISISLRVFQMVTLLKVERGHFCKCRLQSRSFLRCKESKRGTCRSFNLPGSARILPCFQKFKHAAYESDGDKKSWNCPHPFYRTQVRS